jgi:hypothetical protein
LCVHFSSNCPVFCVVVHHDCHDLKTDWLTLFLRASVRFFFNNFLIFDVVCDPMNSGAYSLSLVLQYHVQEAVFHTCVTITSITSVASYDHGVSSDKMIGITVGQYFDQQGRCGSEHIVFVTYIY